MVHKENQNTKMKISHTLGTGSPTLVAIHNHYIDSWTVPGVQPLLGAMRCLSWMRIWGLWTTPAGWVLGLVNELWLGCVGCQCISNSSVSSLGWHLPMQQWPFKGPGVGQVCRCWPHQVHHVWEHSCRSIGDSELWSTRLFLHPVAGPMQWGLGQNRLFLCLLAHSWCNGQRSCWGGGRPDGSVATSSHQSLGSICSISESLS